ncbi:MAG: substrate-binding domain-containing protein [Acidobacteria bacterium]|nr:substrate-binding domain-containing protein [Acidobacteriota bacterium]
MIRKLPHLVLVGILLLPLMNCGYQHDEKEKYYLVAANIKLPYWQAALAGLNKATVQMKVKTELAGPDTYDPRQQQQELQRIIKLKPSGILVSPTDPKLMQADIDDAISQGIPVITIDSDAPGSKRLLFIGTNNYEAGVMGGRIAAKQLGGKGNVMVFTMPGQANLDERLHGYKDVFSEYSGIKIVETINIKGDSRISFDTTQDFFEKKKTPVDGFICLEAAGGKGVAEVLDRRQIKGKTVVAFDTDDETLEWIQKGLIAATIAQKPFTMAYYGVKVLDDIYHHKPQPMGANWANEPLSLLPTFIDTGATVIDQKNLAMVQKPRDFITVSPQK